MKCFIARLATVEVANDEFKNARRRSTAMRAGTREMNRGMGYGEIS